MKILAIDTSTEACSAALYLDGEVHEIHEIAPRRHAELILPMVDRLLSEAGSCLNVMDALAFGRGPGSFTGVRIAAGVIQGLAFAAELPVIPVSSLATLAQGAVESGAVLFSAIDARMNEIYWCAYAVDEDKLVSALGDERVTRPGLIEYSGEYPCYGIGSGWDRYADELRQNLGGKLRGFDPNRFPLAVDMFPLALRAFDRRELVDAGDAIPIYLRNDVTG